MKELSSLKRQDLQRLCKKNGIKASGKNADLIGRLTKIQHIDDGNEGSKDVSMRITTSVAESSQVADAIDTKRDIDVNKGNEAFVNKPFTFTFSNGTFGDAITAAVLAEMEQRVSQAKSITNLPVGISKSELKNNESPVIPSGPRSPVKGFFENVHTKNFEKMDSIVNHYAAKRPFKSIDERDGPEDGKYKAKKLSANSAVSCKSPFKKQKCEHDKVLSPKTILDKQPLMSRTSAIKEREKKRLSATQRLLLNQRAQAKKTPRLTTANRSVILQESRTASNNHLQKPKRLQFDLNASLARKPKYVPYTGPVPPLANKFPKIGVKEGTKENSKENRSVSTNINPIQSQTRSGLNCIKASSKRSTLEKKETKADSSLQCLKPVKSLTKVK